MPLEEDLPPADEAAWGAARRFSAEELVACEACGRANAPTRLGCIYCGASLPVTERSAALRRPSLRRLEEWERGFNVVLLPRACGGLSPEALEEAASLLRLGAGKLDEMASEGRAMPLARASSSEEAGLIVNRLEALGLPVEAVPDEDLCAQEPPLRIRSMSFGQEALVGSKGADSEPLRIEWRDVALFVAGRIVSKRVELEERPGGLKGRSEVVETREVISADDAVLDIYTGDSSDCAGWRISAGSFDYSCLGERKGLLAKENFVTLLEVLRGLAPRAEFDAEYARLRHLLSDVWPLAERDESAGLRRERAGRFNTEAVTVVSNEAQFTRYARLRRLYALRERAEKL